MGKADRIVYGTPLMEANGKAISSFVLAFTIPSKRLDYLEETMGWFYVLKTDVEFCIMENLIRFKRRKEMEGEDVVKYESSKKIELLKLIAQIDNDICKWRASLAKSKTLCE